ncbi:hypothetical protein QR680_001316 [Steinernema hermaphroditum]|uniref:Uncharacterized protein n=1 Tax=Steinernema hermaphroditum TaxID=289476 RepID=A0AA39LFT6_9BILA|nr:hypothetical protein QR680_001316 [Steinernema hermaphroditum]
MPMPRRHHRPPREMQRQEPFSTDRESLVVVCGAVVAQQRCEWRCVVVYVCLGEQQQHHRSFKSSKREHKERRITLRNRSESAFYRSSRRCCCLVTLSSTNRSSSRFENERTRPAATGGRAAEEPNTGSSKSCK